MLYPILPIFLTQNLGATATVIGIVEGIAQATQNVMQGFSGWLSDKLRRRKFGLLIEKGVECNNEYPISWIARRALSSSNPPTATSATSP